MLTVPAGKGQRSLLILLAFALFTSLIYLRESFVAIVTLQAQNPIARFPGYPFWSHPPSVHLYRSDGLVGVQKGGRHPVIELIERAEKEWERKQQRASRTLEQAVAEYERRYKRLPPKGFDDWWKYAQENNVGLPDEYDTIWRDLEPFWGINPVDLQKIQAIQENITDAYTLSLDSNGTIGIVKVATSPTNPLPWDTLTRGSADIMKLLKPVQHLLLPFRITISPHDSPNLVSDYEVKKAALDAAAIGGYANLGKPPKMPRLGFASACDPDSPARKDGLIVDQAVRPPPRTEKTFIHDHRAAMDPCAHPHLFYTHSQFLPYPPKTPKAQPFMSAQFTFCNTMVHHNIQPPSFISWMEDVEPRENDPPWENKTDERMLWRGSNTGMNYNEELPWQFSQRPTLVKLANDMKGSVNVKIPTGRDRSSDEPYYEMNIQKRYLNPAFFDITFAGRPIACPPHYCEYLAQEFEWRTKQELNDPAVGAHKYIIDIDGNGWSSRFKRLITTNSLIFKATIYPEWWLDRIQPWVHYVPIQVDFSDLHDIFTFFRGGLYGEGNHDDLAKKIAYAGRKWSKTYWREEDMTAYFFRLLLEYSRVMSLDRDAMTYVKP